MGGSTAPGPKAEAGMGHPILVPGESSLDQLGAAEQWERQGLLPGHGEICRGWRAWGAPAAVGHAGAAQLRAMRSAGADTGCSGAVFWMPRMVQDAQGSAGMPGVVQDAQGRRGCPGQKRMPRAVRGHLLGQCGVP